MHATPLSESPPFLALRRVSRRFANGVTALSDVSLRAGRGEFVSLLGPSGCGKSTVLRLLSGLDEPSSGQVQRPPDDVGYVFQEPTLMPWASVQDNVRLPLRLRGAPRAEADAAVQAALAAVGLADFARALPRELSGGMKMRASIARALVTRPSLLLLDEPFAALDEITRFKLNQDLLALWQRDAFTALFVTHSVYEAVFLSQRIVVMAARPGRVAAELTVDAPYPRTPAFRSSAEFIRCCTAVSQAMEQASEAAL
ncbi:ABC transporter ATP-binding protein [Aquincola tertiaricarbonis]|uniref:ABC transporter ATP-binding protein n=1 Tax=Aquincola tertiaricarbonis TaxID=391953 RepID=A0ABY4SA24_AQUTE|nr:ABC transporter ATP-binding protein [Aquincola tertiaricarbonis]URI10201.1 ABC transporter ATP-binding protein [Aquincola tertiaricarbonis]